MSLTVLLLNWRRPSSVRRIIQALESQTLKPLIYLWTNGEEEGRQFYPVDWHVSSDENRVCMPRWFMGHYVTTKYVMSCDDDLMPSDPTLCERLVAEMEAELDVYSIHGAFGKKLIATEKYELCPAANRGERCDIILGRMLCLRTDILRRLCLPYGDRLAESTDDILLSGLLHRGIKRHLCSTVFDNSIEELPDTDALCHREGHFELREQARRKWLLV